MGKGEDQMSDLIIPAKKPEIELNILEYMVMCYVWEKELMRKEAIKLMQESMVKWHRFAQWHEDGALMFILSHLASIIKMADEGKYQNVKGLYKQNNINWRKVYNLPGARTQEDIEKAQIQYEVYRREHPDTEI